MADREEESNDHARPPNHLIQKKEGMTMEKKIDRREFLRVTAAAGAILSMAPNLSLAEEQKAIQLLKPQAGSGNPLMQLLWKRMTSREFSLEPLPVEVLSNLLWAAFGVNRPDGKRTAPTASNRQEIDIYAALASGLYLYDAKTNLLNPILAEDIRAATGRQPYVKDVAVNLIFVADYAKMGTASSEDKTLLAAAATGLISGNVYLYCASEGLATVVRANIEKPALANVMKLRPDQKVILAQSVGYPKK
jgi:nitroreductase